MWSLKSANGQIELNASEINIAKEAATETRSKESNILYSKIERKEVQKYERKNYRQMFLISINFSSERNMLR